MSRTIEVRPGVYHDSVTLMQLSQALVSDPAVAHAQVAMGTALNLDLLVDAGYERPAAGAGDLVIALDGTDEELDRVLALVNRLLEDSARNRPGIDSPDAAVRTVAAAVGRGATVVMISVPGEHAFRQALQAVEAGAHPVIFSDNVSTHHEIILKRRAHEAGLLAMGPDCGTVILEGTGLGFANVVSPGPIGLVSASGTGAQQVCALADHAEVGVRHVLGVGGRDLGDDVGGLSAFPAIRLLDADPAIEVIGVIAKNIGNKTRHALGAIVDRLDTPTVMIPSNDLTAGTTDLLDAIGARLPELRTWAPPTLRDPRPGYVLGLFSGGTLAAEADLILSSAGTPAHIIDLGDDGYTRGRPHPMIDLRLRLERLAEVATSDEVGSVLLDVVLGHGSARDPAAELGPVLADLTVPVFVALIGTAGDPQGLDAQAEALAASGASVFLSNAAAARAAAPR